MTPHAIVTRPAREAAQWAEDLRAHGIAAQALPLIAIGPVTPPALRQALDEARTAWTRYRAVMFVSGNAALHFFEPNQPPALSGQAPAATKTRAWAPGPGTVAALRQAGLPLEAIDGPAPHAPQFDSEALWQVVAPQIGPGDRVLIVRGTSSPAAEGGNGRDWLAARIAEAGGAVDFVAAYERSAPRLDADQQALAARAAADGSVWLLSSSEAVSHLQAALPAQPWGNARALATHPRIAQAARAAGFGIVNECRPALPDVAASIKSLVYEH
jgi:uroporphyrinogen-III synthase